MTDNLFAAAHHCLVEADPDRKAAQAVALEGDWSAGRLAVDPAIDLPDVVEAGRPERPVLVDARRLSRRGAGSPEGRAALVHAVAHIELNAINLACDAVFRFRDMPEAFYGDWIRVAAEEAHHFRLLRDRLRELGHDYGDFPAHRGLWDMAQRTAGDVVARMALVPRVLEARGLDVTPGIMERLRRAGDDRTADLLVIILRDEIGHVAAGTRWFRHVCAARGLEPEAEYFRLLGEFLRGELRCPLHLEARRQAGFSESELERLQAMCEKGSEHLGVAGPRS
jgi:uncharacterized ferritin-like protein (DUF455 family)